MGPGGLLEEALTRENLQAAWKRIKANKGAGGYRPNPVRKMVMAWLRKLDGLRLQINEAKRAACSALGRKFLGYVLLWVAPPRAVRSSVQWPTRGWTTSRPGFGNSHAAQEGAA